MREVQEVQEKNIVREAKAKAEYIRRRAVGENINLKEFAGEMGANYESLRRWKVKDGWEKDVPRKRGGQPGNTNSKKKKNAKGNKGGGAPTGNKNAEKDGAYSAVFFDALPEADKDFLNKTPTGAVENLLHELKVLRWREKKIIEKIHEYEQVEDEETLYLNGTMMDMEVLGPDKEQLKQCHAAIAAFLSEMLHLDLNAKTCIRPVSMGIEFVGQRVWATHAVLRKSTARRMKREVRRISEDVRDGVITRQEYQRRVASIRGMMDHTNSGALR